jgi:drug/metabolite transporter (DMT)-like permease
MERVLGVLMVALSAVSFGFMPIFARFAYADGMNSITLLFLRFTIASLVMLGVMRRSGAAFPRGRAFLGLLLMGGVGYVGQSFSYFTALNYASASLVALLLYVYPALVAVLSAVLFKEPLTVRKVTALVLASAGTAMIIGLNGSAKPLGILLGLSAAVIYSFYIIAGSRIIPPGGEIPASTLIMLSAAVVYGVLTLVTGPRFPETGKGALAVLGIALISTVVAILTFFLGLRRLGPTNASMISTLEPVVTVIFAAVLLGETLTPLNAAGGALVLAAVVLLTCR